MNAAGWSAPAAVTFTWPQGLRRPMYSIRERSQMVIAHEGG